MFRNAKIIFYFSQFYKIRLGENIYHYNPQIESFALLRALIKLLRHAVRAPFREAAPNLHPKYKQLIYTETINQKNAMVDIFLHKENKAETLFILNDLNGKLTIPQYDQKDFPKRKSFWKSLLYLPKAYIISAKYVQKQKRKVNCAHILTNLSRFMAIVDLFEGELVKYNIEQVIVTNDHNLHTLALLLASKNKRIKSYYFQHASVSPAFPKLLPDVAIVEGQQAVDIYRKIGNLSKQLYMAGIPRLDGVIGLKKQLNTQKITVGFCLKPHYSDDLIEEYLNAILAVDNVKKVILRPHPGNGEKFYKRLKSYKVEISNARKERPHDFIKKLDLLISGESSIILESSLMKVKTIYIDDKVAQYDLYGFVKNGIATAVHSMAELKKELQQIDFQKVEEQFSNCKYYCSTVNTEFENSSKELIMKILNND